MAGDDRTYDFDEKCLKVLEVDERMLRLGLAIRVTERLYSIIRYCFCLSCVFNDINFIMIFGYGITTSTTFCNEF